MSWPGFGSMADATVSLVPSGLRSRQKYFEIVEPGTPAELARLFEVHHASPLEVTGPHFAFGLSGNGVLDFIASSRTTRFFFASSPTFSPHLDLPPVRFHTPPPGLAAGGGGSPAEAPPENVYSTLFQSSLPWSAGKGRFLPSISTISGCATSMSWP